MKNIIILIGLTIYSQFIFATEKLTKSKVERVTIFTQGAQVFRTANITLGSGITHVVFSGLTPGINPSSIQAGGKGAFVVMDVKHRIKYPEPVQNISVPKAITSQIEQLEDSLTELGFRKEEIQDRLTSLLLEKDMIVKNKLARGEGKSDSLEVLKQAIEYFHKRLGELNTLIGKTKRDQYRNTEAIETTTQKLQELRAYKHDTEPDVPYQPDNQVVVAISADAPTTGVIEISYMVSGAGWTPSYDLRASNTSEPVKLTYKANVFQSTGEDWGSVRIKLSTSNPNRSHIKPSLPVWYLSYYTAHRQVVVGGARSQSTDNVSHISKDLEETYAEKLQSMSPAESSANFSQLIETMANVEFEIKLEYDIPSDGNAHIVAVKTESLPSTFTHYLVPKVESEAFLLARVTGWENLSLLPGNANLFYDGTYVGQTVINPNIINDTLELAMGRDQAITVTRTRLKDKESNKLFGTDITRTVAYELRIKSNKGKSINLMVEDQIPISGMKEIKVELKDSDKADYNPVTGSLTWDFKMDSKTYKSIKFIYDVTHNKDMPLSMY